MGADLPDLSVGEGNVVDTCRVGDIESTGCITVLCILEVLIRLSYPTGGVASCPASPLRIEHYLSIELDPSQSVPQSSLYLLLVSHPRLSLITHHYNISLPSDQYQQEYCHFPCLFFLIIQNAYWCLDIRFRDDSFPSGRHQMHQQRQSEY